MTDWHDVVVTATVGTASRPLDLAATPEPVLSAAPPGTDPAGSLLDAAVAFTVARRAGRRPGRGEIPEPAPDDSRAVVSPVAAELLRAVLVDRELDLALVVLGLIVDSGRRLPPALVPTALGLASRHTHLRVPTVRAAGPLASWLGRQNPAWTWAVPGAAVPTRSFDVGAWETGDRAERLLQLRALRHADPAAAATLLQQSWPTTAPDERADLLAVLGPRPHPSDEPLLEATLDDRRAAVRRLAADLLARLEGSAFRRRAADRAHGLLRIERRGLRRVLVVTAPTPFDAAARRDGLQEAPGPTHALGAMARAGPVAERVRQLVAVAPLTVWEQDLSAEPAHLLGLAADDADELLTGWVEAALREQDPRWVEALLDVARHRGPVQRRRADLVTTLPAERRTRVVVAALEQRVDDAAGMLAVAPTPWETPVVTAFLRWWRRAATSSPGRELLPVLPLVGRGLPATVEHAALLRAAADRATVGAIWPRAARTAADTLDLRRRLHEELR